MFQVYPHQGDLVSIQMVNIVQICPYHNASHDITVTFPIKDLGNNILCQVKIISNRKMGVLIVSKFQSSPECVNLYPAVTERI